MRKMLSIILLFLGLGVMSGCSVKLATMSTRDKKLQSLPHRNFSEMSLKVTKSNEDPNKITIRHINNSKIELAMPCSIKYQSFYFDFIDIIAVTGTLPTDKRYSVLLDTGHPGYVMTNSLTVLENKFAVCPVGASATFGSHMGFCRLPSVKLGQAVITDPPCTYLQQQWEVRLLGLPVWQQRGVLLGLGLLKDFSYIEFNNIKKEVELSVTSTFKPDNPELWDSYPLEIRNGRLMVKMPVEGQTFNLMFDSCGRYGMIVGPGLWEKMPLKADAEKLRDGKFESGFLGKLPCQRTRIKKLNIGNVTARHAEIVILPKESPYMEAVISIGMKFFKKTIVVLDFKNGFMWIKK